MLTHTVNHLYPRVPKMDSFHRFFDHVLDIGENTRGFPAFNIEVLDENQYAMTFAVAGYTMDNLDIEVNGNHLLVSGKPKSPENSAHYLYRGISTKGFSRRFRLSEHVEVHEASLQDGLLTIRLQRELPEALKPRKISISNTVN